MFGFFKDLKARLIALEYKVEVLFKHKEAHEANAQQDTQAEEVHAGGSAQPELRSEGGDQAVSGEGVQPSGSGEAVEAAPVEGQ